VTVQWINYFDSSTGNGILVYIMIGVDLQKLRGKWVIFLCKLNIFTSACTSIKGASLAEKKLMLQLINLPPKFLRKGCKNLPPYFFHGAFAPSFIQCRRPWLWRIHVKWRVSRSSHCVLSYGFISSSEHTMDGCLLALTDGKSSWLPLVTHAISFLRIVRRPGLAVACWSRST